MGDVQGRFAVVPWMVIEKLNAQEMGLYCALAVHADKSGWCWPSRETLARLCQKSEPWVTATLKELERKMVIEVWQKGTGNTVSKYRLPVSSTLYPPDTHQPAELGGQPADMRGQPADPNNTKNNTININPPIVPPKGGTSKLAEGWVDFQTDFEKMWEMYPRKVGKGAARKAFARVVRGVSANQFVTAYFKSLERWERDKTEVQYIPHLATWLNQERWSDE